MQAKLYCDKAKTLKYAGDIAFNWFIEKERRPTELCRLRVAIGLLADFKIMDLRQPI